MKKNKISKYKYIIIISIMIIILLLIIFKPIILGYAILQNFLQKNSNSNVQKPVLVTKENLPNFLASQQMVNDLPDNSLILLRLYNFDNGNRNWEESYIIKKGKVEKGYIENPDITIVLSSKYINDLGNFCQTLKLAKANGDISYDTKMSQLSLMWKYSKMLKYRGCFGL